MNGSDNPAARKKKHTVVQVTILLMNRDDRMERLL